MVKKINVSLLAVLIFTMSGCEMAYKKKLGCNYYLTANDIIEDIAITHKTDEEYGYSIIVYSAVFAVGFDEYFILAKQHPGFFSKNPDKSITNYYIIPLKNKINEDPTKNIIGPLTKSEFADKRKELGVNEELDFTIIIEELE